METIMMTGSQHRCCFNVDRVVMTGSYQGTIVMTRSHHGNSGDDWQSAQVLLQREQSYDDWKSLWEQ